jgi:hypothetical protein
MLISPKGTLFNIPWLGGLLRDGWNTIIAGVWGILSIFDFIAGLIGIRPEKRMRIMIIVQENEEGQPVATDPQILPLLQLAIDVFKKRPLPGTSRKKIKQRRKVFGAFPIAARFRSRGTFPKATRLSWLFTEIMEIGIL